MATLVKARSKQHCNSCGCNTQDTVRGVQCNPLKLDCSIQIRINPGKPRPAGHCLCACPYRNHPWLKRGWSSVCACAAGKQHELTKASSLSSLSAASAAASCCMARRIDLGINTPVSGELPAAASFCAASSSSTLCTDDLYMKVSRQCIQSTLCLCYCQQDFVGQRSGGEEPRHPCKHEVAASLHRFCWSLLQMPFHTLRWV